MLYMYENNGQYYFHKFKEDAQMQLISSIKRLTYRELDDRHANDRLDSVYYIYRYDGDISIDTFNEAKNFLDDIDDEELKEVISTEFECITAVDLYQMNDWQFERLDTILKLWFNLKEGDILSWDSIVIDYLQYECDDVKNIDAPYDWYGDYFPKDWVGAIESIKDSYPDDFELFANECQDVCKMIKDSYRDYEEMLEELESEL